MYKAQKYKRKQKERERKSQAGSLINSKLKVGRGSGKARGMKDDVAGNLATAKQGVAPR